MSILFIVLGLFVLLVAYFLMFKTVVFLPLVAENLKETASGFLRIFGGIFILLGLFTIATSFFDRTIIYMIALLAILFASAIFSLTYAKFIGKNNP